MLLKKKKLTGLLEDDTSDISSGQNPVDYFYIQVKRKIYFQYEPKNRGERVRACILWAAARHVSRGGEERKGKKIRRITNNNNNNNSLSKTREYIIVFRRRQDGTGEKKIKRKKRVLHHFHRIRRRSFMFERTHRPNSGAVVQLRPRFFA